jgi:hypothetical protein
MWLKLNINSKQLIIGTAYRPPWLDVDTFFDAVTDSITSFVRYDRLILLGDFNINYSDKNDRKFKSLIQFLTTVNLTQHVSEPTHFTEHSETTIDLICTDARVVSVDVKHIPDLGRHAFITAELDIKRRKPTPRRITYRPIKDINLSDFNNDLDSIDWDQILLLDNVNDMVRQFNSLLLGLFDRHAPEKAIVVKEALKPWLTSNVRLMMRLRNGAHARFKRTRSEAHKRYYLDLKHLVIGAIHSEKCAFFEHHINGETDSKTLWKNLKRTVLPDSQAQTDLPAHFDDPDLINRHFLSLPGKSDVTISDLTFYEFDRHNDKSFMLLPTTTATVTKIMTSIKTTAKGLDGIDIDMLLLTLPRTADILTYIINKSIETTTFPSDWKIAQVIPLPKKPNPTDLSQLRPISILPCMSKIIERVVCQQLSDYLEKYNILPELQSGFRKGRSTVTALLDVVDNILQARDVGKSTILVLLDFSRAFDCINVPLLLSKMSYYGFDVTAIEWFSSYLSGRTQTVALRGMDGGTLRSSLCPVTRGVPQGSILGPLLFILYSADITSSIRNCGYHLYADDLQLYFSSVPSDTSAALDNINADLNRVSSWSEKNCLVLNPGKTKYVVFGSKHQIRNTLHALTSGNVSVMNEPIERVVEANNLGLLMDGNLRFETHILKVVSNCFYRLKVLYNIRDYLSIDLRVELCESLILSRLNYCDVIYDGCIVGRSKRLIQRVQNACARFCFRVPPRSHITPYLNAANLLNMPARRRLHLATLLFGVVHHENPSYLFKKIKWSKSARRFKALAIVPMHRTAAFRGSFRFAASKCWNDLPPPIQGAPSKHTFKRKLKGYLLTLQKSQS